MTMMTIVSGRLTIIAPRACGDDEDATTLMMMMTMMDDGEDGC